MSNLGIETALGTFYIINIIGLCMIFYILYLTIRTLHLSIKALKKYLKDWCYFFSLGGYYECFRPFNSNSISYFYIS